MSDVLEIVKYVLPSIVVMITSFWMIRTFLDNDNKRKNYDLKHANQQLITPLKLQAYERVVMFLERINPNSLIPRIHKHGMSSHMLQSELVKNIKAEFEHNLSQQVYMSNDSWEMVKASKEETIKLINIASTKVSDTATGLELAEIILQISGSVKKLPTVSAIEQIKREISHAF